jgi:hypothetical protein
MTAGAKKVKAGKPGAGAYKPVKAASAKLYGISGAALLTAINRGLISGSGTANIMLIKEGALQK